MPTSIGVLLAVLGPARDLRLSAITVLGGSKPGVSMPAFIGVLLTVLGAYLRPNVGCYYSIA
jgi:hypothetical protein